MTRPTCDECTRLATGLCDHDNPVCDVCECTCETTPGLAVDIAVDGTATVTWTPPTSEHRTYTEAEMTAILRDRYSKPGNGGSGEYAFLAQVRNAAGFDANRTFDAVVIDLYPSRHLSLHVIEIKVSRSDWLRELRDQRKAADALAVADFFWIAAPKGIVKRDELPDGWGLLEVNGDAARAAVAAKRLTPTPPDWRTFQPIDRGLVAAMLRAAPGAVPGRTRQRPIDAALSDDPPTPAVRDALLLVGLDLPREA